MRRMLTFVARVWMLWMLCSGNDGHQRYLRDSRLVQPLTFAGFLVFGRLSVPLTDSFPPFRHFVQRRHQRV